MDHYQYLLLMGACLVITVPLEVLLGARVWRQPRRLAGVVLPPVVMFSLWDVVAIAHHLWGYDMRYLTGVVLPGRLPVEELVFFIVIPICSLLTFEAVRNLLGRQR